MHRTLKTNGGDLQRLLPIQRALTEIQHDVKEAREAVESVVDSDAALNAVPPVAPGTCTRAELIVPPAAAGSALQCKFGRLLLHCALLRVIRSSRHQSLCALALAVVKFLNGAKQGQQRRRCA